MHRRIFSITSFHGAPSTLKCMVANPVGVCRVVRRQRLDLDLSDHLRHRQQRLYGTTTTTTTASSSTTTKTTGRLILVRHGQSIWNHGTEYGARFTGWANIPLTELGIEQAHLAGRTLRNSAFRIDVAVTSLLQRARSTLQIILQELQLLEHHEDHHPHHQLNNNNNQIDNKNPSTLSTKNQNSSSASSSSHHHHHHHHHSHMMMTVLENHHPHHHVSCKIPIMASWRLNERNYGSLVGMSKTGAEEFYGKETLGPWRHSWDVRPPPMSDDVLLEWSQHHPHCQMVTIIQKPIPIQQQQQQSRRHDDTSTTVPPPTTTATSATTLTTSKATFTDMATVQVLEKGLPWHGSIPVMPASESLADTCQRVMPLWEWGIAPHLLRGDNVLMVAHANTVKAMLRILDPHVVTPDIFSQLHIPNTTPLVYQFRPVHDYEDDTERIPGGLAVVVPPERPDLLSSSSTTPTTTTTIKDKSELRFQLRAHWLEEG